MTIDASQNVGIGTSSPTNRLTVNGGNGSTPTIRLNGGTAADDNALISSKYNLVLGCNADSNISSRAITFINGTTENARIDSSGNLGIGTTSPTTLVDLVRSSTTGSDISMPNLYVRNTSATQGNGSSTFNQASLYTSAGNGTVSGGIRAAYDSAGPYGTGMQLYVNSTNPLQFYTNSSQRMLINSSGQLVMATSTYGLNGQLQVGITASTSGMNSLFSVAGDQNGGYPIGSRGNSSTQGLIGFFDSSNSTIGSITKSGSSVAYNTSSDYRLKENIVPMTGALNIIAQLKPVTYKWKADGKNGQGFIAHELAKVVPDCVTGEKDAVETYKDEDGNEQTRPKYQGVDTSFLVATLTAAIQEQQTIINTLTARIVALENK